MRNQASRKLPLLKLSLMLLLGLLVAPGRPTAQPASFNAFMLPPSTHIEIGDIAFLAFEVDSTAQSFDGYEITVRYDPTIVELVEVEQGALMLDACATSPFFILTYTDTSVTVSHVILCGGLTLDGPGVLSTYAFRGLANGASQIEIISDPDETFVEAGVWINPAHPTMPRQVFLHDALIQVGPVGAVEGWAPVSPLRLEPNRPNPFNPYTQIVFHTRITGPAEFAVWNAAGRRVWHRTWARLGSGRHQLTWHGTTPDGHPLPSGVYLCTLQTPSGNARDKMTLLR